MYVQQHTHTHTSTHAHTHTHTTITQSKTRVDMFDTCLTYLNKVSPVRFPTRPAVSVHRVLRVARFHVLRQPHVPTLPAHARCPH